eukprot:1770806-Amphidinium_carterae.1
MTRTSVGKLHSGGALDAHSGDQGFAAGISGVPTRHSGGARVAPRVSLSRADPGLSFHAWQKPILDDETWLSTGQFFEGGTLEDISIAVQNSASGPKEVPLPPLRVNRLLVHTLFFFGRPRSYPCYPTNCRFIGVEDDTASLSTACLQEDLSSSMTRWRQYFLCFAKATGRNACDKTLPVGR